MPSLDLDKIKHTRCLLLGAGTLGCYVARTLMVRTPSPPWSDMPFYASDSRASSFQAWGVRKITLVDSSTVSYSNPVRQPLFEFEDSLHGGKRKAEAAAAALKRIYPGVVSAHINPAHSESTPSGSDPDSIGHSQDASGMAFSIPMPGHPIPPTARDSTRQDLEKLEALVGEHDVVYLLMDSRESRWLPTVIGAAKGKVSLVLPSSPAALLTCPSRTARHECCPRLRYLPRHATRSSPRKPSRPRRGQARLRIPRTIGLLLLQRYRRPDGCTCSSKPIASCSGCRTLTCPRCRGPAWQSLSDRTLDQMCTVTRPGIASIASSTAVELMVSILQHPKGCADPIPSCRLCTRMLTSPSSQRHGTVGRCSGWWSAAGSGGGGRSRLATRNRAASDSRVPRQL